MLAAERRFRPVSSLHGACRDTLDDVFLVYQIEDDNRDDTQQDQSHCCTEIHGSVTAFQILDMNGNCPILVDVKHQIWQQIVVPDPHNLQNSDRDHGRLQHRDDHREIGTDRAATVNGCSFLNPDIPSGIKSVRK